MTCSPTSHSSLSILWHQSLGCHQRHPSAANLDSWYVVLLYGSAISLFHPGNPRPDFHSTFSGLCNPEVQVLNGKVMLHGGKGEDSLGFHLLPPRRRWFIIQYQMRNFRIRVMNVSPRSLCNPLLSVALLKISLLSSWKVFACF